MDKNKKAEMPFIFRLCLSLEQTDKPWCEFCGRQFFLGFKMCRNGRGDTVFVCDECLEKAKK